MRMVKDRGIEHLSWSKNPSSFMLRQVLAALSIVIGAVAISGCTESNPLIGSWKAKVGQPAASLFPCQTIDFEGNLSRCGSLAERVTYEIRDEEVVVHGESGLSAVYKVIDANTIAIDIPMAGQLKFSRVRY